jgi:hypothetical protein
VGAADFPGCGKPAWRGEGQSTGSSAEHGQANQQAGTRGRSSTAAPYLRVVKDETAGVDFPTVGLDDEGIGARIERERAAIEQRLASDEEVRRATEAAGAERASRAAEEARALLPELRQAIAALRVEDDGRKRSASGRTANPDLTLVGSGRVFRRRSTGAGLFRRKGAVEGWAIVPGLVGFDITIGRTGKKVLLCSRTPGHDMRWEGTLDALAGQGIVGGVEVATIFSVLTDVVVTYVAGLL